MVFSTTIFHFIYFLLYIHGIIISLKKEVNHMIMHNDWDQLFDQEIQKDYLLNLRYFLAEEYKTKISIRQRKIFLQPLKQLL